jgi:hypothetical protein
MLKYYLYRSHRPLQRSFSSLNAKALEELYGAALLTSVPTFNKPADAAAAGTYRGAINTPFSGSSA